MSERHFSTPSYDPYCAKANMCETTLDDENGKDVKSLAKTIPEASAKYPHSFLEESQGDSSLEPGEVKTPPHDGISAIEMQSVEKLLQNTTYNDQNNQKTVRKKQSLKTTSQLEAEMCKEKVRAILELDAIKRKDEVEKRKLQKGLVEKSNKNKNEGNSAQIKDDGKKMKKSKTDRISEQAFHYSELERDIKTSSIYMTNKNYVSKASTTSRDHTSVALEIPSDYSCTKSDIHLNSSTNLSDSDNFVSFRSMNPFMNGSYSEFHNSRRYVPRNRGGNLNCFRFPSFRPQYFNSNTLPLRHQNKSGNQYLSLPIRSRSPMQLQKYNLLWTKVKPSISYAFNSQHKNHNVSSQKLLGKSRFAKSRERTKCTEELGIEKIKKVSTEIKDVSLNKKQKIENTRKELLKFSTVKSGGSNMPKIDQLEDLQLNLVEKQFDSDKQRVLNKKITPENTDKEKYRTNINNITVPEVLTVTSRSESDFEVHTSEKDETIVDIFADLPLKVENTTTNRQDDHKLLEKGVSEQNLIPIYDSLSCRNSTNLNETKSSTNCEAHPIVQTVTHGAGINRSATNKLQEIQDRIDKLLQDDDLKIEIIQATKEKLLQKTNNYVKGLKHRSGKINEKGSTHINSLKCSNSKMNICKLKDSELEGNEIESNNSEYTNIPNLKIEQKNIDLSKSVNYDILRNSSKNYGNQGSKYKNMICNKPNEADNQLSNPLNLERSSTKIFSHASFKRKTKSEKHGQTFTKRRLTTLSLSFLEENTDNAERYKKNTRNVPDAKNCDTSRKKGKTISEFSQMNSPDTDDYSDNWENEDVESNFILQNDYLTESNVCRFANPSPPRDTQIINLENRSTTPTTSPPKCEFEKHSLRPLQMVKNTKEIIVQDIKVGFVNSEENNKTITKSYDEFKSLGEASKSQSTSSSTSPSSTTTSNSSTSSSSTTTSSTSSSDESNDNCDGFEQPTGKANEFPLESIKEQHNKVELAASVNSELIHGTGVNNTSIKKDSPNGSHSSDVTDISLPLSSSQINMDSTKDLKKLKILESNLSRIQMMRANYDCVDEISEELSKMEKLFSQERKLLLQKCGKQSSCLTNVDTQTVTECNTNDSESVLQTSQSDSQVELPQSLENGNTCDIYTTRPNIFDTNRETIKLIISPIKFSKTSALLKLGKTTENKSGNSEDKTESTDDTDFTEKLLKPVKEIAIVKPIMESKELQLKNSSHRKSSHSISSRRRSPNYRDSFRRSFSRSRYSPSHHDRVRSLSVSPSRRSNKRYLSPQRRHAISSQIRYRNTSRRTRSRSRSRSRSTIRSVNRRINELSPVQRRRRQSEIATGKYRKNRTLRESRSPLSPVSSVTGVRQSRQGSHSPARSSPLSLKHCSQNRGKYSRSPLPFKPPSPPTNQSLSPIITRRHNSFSPTRISPYRSNSGSPSHSPRMMQSSDYDDNYRSRFKSYDRHSLSPEREYYSVKSTKSNFYNLSPNRMSLDARINIVLTGQSSNHERSCNEILPFDDYTSYTQYGGATYMSLPSDANSYYTNQYVHITNTESNHPNQTYSNLNNLCNVVPSSAPQMINASNNFYYNEFDFQLCGSSRPSPLLKELPKATVAVQKGNVLEIVPSNEILPVQSSVKSQSELYEPQMEKGKNAAILWKNEISDRQKRTAAIRLARRSENSSHGILKKSYPSTAVNSSQYEKLIRKKVYFEDGIYPNHDSDCEDRKVVEAKMRIKFRNIRKKHGIIISKSELIQKKSQKENLTLGSDIANLPPLPPSGAPGISIEQPVYIRPLTPTPLLYFHFDSFVHSMYVSQMERPIPPRLLNPKCLPLCNVAAASLSSSMQSPLLAESPNNSTIGNMPNNKMESVANSTPLGSQTENMCSSSLSNFNPIMVKNINIGSKQQPSPLRWVNMRTSNIMHLPPSPLTRDTQMSSTNKVYPAGESVASVGQLFDVAPPSVVPMVVNPQCHSSTGEYSIQSPLEQKQYDYHHQNSILLPLTELSTSYTSLSQAPQISFQQRYLPTSSQNQVSNYLVQEFASQSIQGRHLINPKETTTNGCPAKSPQAMVVPFNIKQNIEE